MAMTAERILLDIPGIGRIDAMKGGTFDIGGTKRNPKSTDNNKVHYGEEIKPSSISCKVANTKGMLAKLRDISGVNVNVQDDNGDSWIITNAFSTETRSVSNGEISLDLAGDPAEPA